MKELRIGLYVGAWPQNIGNAFFDLGAETIVKKAFPSAKIYRLGGSVHWMFNNSKFAKYSVMRRILRRLGFIKFKANGNSLEIGEIAEIDLLVFAGMSMCEEFVLNNGPTFIEANKRGVAILGLGAGGSLYSEKEAQIFSSFFEKFNKAAIITRDDDTYKLYENKIKIIESGIDCAFFLPDYYKAPKLNLIDFEVFTFDSSKIPKHLKSNEGIKIFAHHDLWGPLPRRNLKMKNTIISDVPEDYLAIYANCKVTFSDRVHACIASLAYGNYAQLFNSTPRKALFTRLGLDDVGSRPVRLDMENLTKLKMEQVKKTKNIILRLIND